MYHKFIHEFESNITVPLYLKNAYRFGHFKDPFFFIKGIFKRYFIRNNTCTYADSTGDYF